jgi:type III restriction enzyme
LNNAEVQQRLVATVKRWAEEAAPPQASLPGIEPQKRPAPKRWCRRWFATSPNA